MGSLAKGFCGKFAEILRKVHGKFVLLRQESQARKIGPKREFLGWISRGHPGVIRADIPAQNFGQGA